MIKFAAGGLRSVIGEGFICENVLRVAADIVNLAQLQKTERTVAADYAAYITIESASYGVTEYS